MTDREAPVQCPSTRHRGDRAIPCTRLAGHYGDHFFDVGPVATADPVPDPVNHPAHYRLASGVEVIDLTEQLDFLRGNAVKYLARAGRKEGVDELEDLRKAQWYVNRAVENLERSRQAGA